MQKLKTEQLEDVRNRLLAFVPKIKTAGELLFLHIEKDESGETMNNEELARWFATIYWKSLMFDEMNRGYSAIEKQTGEKTGPFSTQWELANALNKSPVVLSRYYTGAMASKQYKFINEDFYTFDRNFLNYKNDESN